MTSRQSSTGAGRWRLAVKVLCAIHAALNGQKQQRLYMNTQALPYFRSAYKSRSVDKLVEPAPISPA